MKKIIYSALLVLATMMTITSCTEETVTPIADTHNGGGNGDGESLGNPK